MHSIGIISVGRGVDQRRGPAVRGKGRLVHGALETLTHTTQQVTTHSSEPHPQASVVVPSSHTMRWLLAVSCLSLSRAVPIPTSPITPAPETRAPPTVVPPAACEALLSPPLVATIKAPVQAEYVECWTFQCVGTVEVTFRIISIVDQWLMLHNSDGYVLTSLFENRERYIATYPANGEMTVVFNDTRGNSYYYENKFTFEWVCNTGPAVVPAAGFDASTYLTLPPAGTYERMFSEPAIYSWLIPCTGMLDIAASSSADSDGVFIFTNSNGTILADDWSKTTFNGTFSVAGNFNITLHSNNKGYGALDDKFAFAWSCGGTRPDLPSPDPTPAPETRAPPTAIPRAACEALLSPRLLASIRAPTYAPYVVCWTFQCVGTLEVTLIVSSWYGKRTLQNSDGYVLTSFMEKRERYNATFPANGEMMLVFNDTGGISYLLKSDITFEWVCNTGPAVVPAAGFDASTYLTLPPVGTYERIFSGRGIYSWLIPCTGMLDIAAFSSFAWGVEFIFTDSDGTILRTDKTSTDFNEIFSVAGNFNITMHSERDTLHDSVFAFTWSCGGATAVTSSPPVPDSAAPPKLPALTVSPTPWSAGTSSAPTTPALRTPLPTTTPTPAPDTALPTATPTDQPAATFAPSAPAVKALCTTDKDCRSGRLDPKATCNAGTCVCHTQGYVHPTGVPLCLLADDVTVSPQLEESGGSSNVVLYVGIGVGVLVVAVCVVAAFYCLQKKQRATVLDRHEMRSTEGDTEDMESEGGSELDLF